MKVNYRGFVIILIIVIIIYSIVLIEGYTVNGEEPDWDPERWRTHERVNNCYAYAFDNLKLRDGKPQPDNQDPDKFNCRDLVKWINRDLVDQSGNKYYMNSGSFDQPCPKGTHKIYLVHSGDDYHFYRLDSDGKWSHKPGSTPVIREDADGKEIIDPSKANHNYGHHNYDTSCGFFCVPKIDEKF